MQHGPKEEMRVAALCADALPLAANRSPQKYASEGEHRASEKLASGVFGQKSLPCFRAVERLSGKLSWGCENSSGETAAGSAVTIDGASLHLRQCWERTAKTDQRTAVARRIRLQHVDRKFAEYMVNGLTIHPCVQGAPLAAAALKLKSSGRAIEGKWPLDGNAGCPCSLSRRSATYGGGESPNCSARPVNYFNW
jgi:hypothetical protein